jgi:adenylate cyclase class 2
MESEIEAKFFLADKDEARKKLEQAGFTLRTPEHLMTRKAFDVPSEGPGHRWGRVRQEAGRVTMSVKHDLGTGINGVSEAEITVDDFDRAVQFLEAAGFKFKAFHENLREVWTRGDVEAAIDTWPGLSPFVEIEGPSEDAVRQASADLGFDFGWAVFGGVAPMYATELGIPEKVVNDEMPEITFANPPKKLN